MRIYIVKRKGVNRWYNIFLNKEMIFEDGDIVHAGLLFIRKMDANKYLQTLNFKEFYEVVGATLDNK